MVFNNANVLITTASISEIIPQQSGQTHKIHGLILTTNSSTAITATIYSGDNQLFALSIVDSGPINLLNNESWLWMNQGEPLKIELSGSGTLSGTVIYRTE